MNKINLEIISVAPPVEGREDYKRNSIEEWVHVDCPQCDFNCGGYYRRDLTPTRPLHFVCKRDRVKYCGYEWSIVVTEEAFYDYEFQRNKKLVLSHLLKEEQHDR